MSEEEQDETPQTWAEVHQSSAKDGRLGWKYGASGPNAEAGAAELARVREALRTELAGWRKEA